MISSNITPIQEIHTMPKISFATPPSWKTELEAARKNKGITVSELMQKFILLAASGDINLNAEVMVYDSDGNCDGIEKVQCGPGNIIVLR